MTKYSPEICDHVWDYSYPTIDTYPEQRFRKCRRCEKWQRAEGNGEYQDEPRTKDKRQ
jgi:hypothetical protein